MQILWKTVIPKKYLSIIDPVERPAQLARSTVISIWKEKFKKWEKKFKQNWKKVVTRAIFHAIPKYQDYKNFLELSWKLIWNSSGITCQTQIVPQIVTRCMDKSEQIFLAVGNWTSHEDLDNFNSDSLVYQIHFLNFSIFLGILHFVGTILNLSTIFSLGSCTGLL